MSSATKTMGGLATLLRDAFPRHATKRAAMAADVPVETARSWVKGKFVPSADTLLRMAERDDAMADALERLLHARRLARSANRSPSCTGQAVAVAGAEAAR